MSERFGSESGVEPRSTYPPPPAAAAVFIRKLQGRSQAVLVEGNDHTFYVVKWRATVAHCGNIASEFIGTTLCQALGLSVPPVRLVEVSENFFDHHPGAWLQTKKGPVRPPAGVHYGTAFVGKVEGPGRPFQMIHGASTDTVRNRDEFCGMYLFDIWAHHLGRRKSLYLADRHRRDLHTVFIDNGMLFGGPSWQFSDPSSQVSFRQKDACNVLWRGTSVDGWIERFKTVIPKALPHILSLVPAEWCIGNLEDLQRTLLDRLAEIDEIVKPFVLENHTATVFPNVD